MCCGQIEKVESELCRSKSLYERQSHDFEQQRDELLRSHAQQLAELKLAGELEQARLMDEFRAQMELRRAQKEKDLSELRGTLQADTAEVEQRAKERADYDAKVHNYTCYQIHLDALYDSVKCYHATADLAHMLHIAKFAPYKWR